MRRSGNSGSTHSLAPALHVALTNFAKQDSRLVRSQVPRPEARLNRCGRSCFVPVHGSIPRQILARLCSGIGEHRCAHRRIRGDFRFPPDWTGGDTGIGTELSFQKSQRLSHRVSADFLIFFFQISDSHSVLCAVIPQGTRRTCVIDLTVAFHPVRWMTQQFSVGCVQNRFHCWLLYGSAGEVYRRRRDAQQNRERKHKANLYFKPPIMFPSLPHVSEALISLPIASRRAQSRPQSQNRAIHNLILLGSSPWSSESSYCSSYTAVLVNFLAAELGRL